MAFLISSWIIIHIFAIFGIFLALAYPIWWLFAPRHTVCFICNTKKDGSYCPVCRRQIQKSQTVIPANLKSALINGLIILIITAISALIVWGESRLLYKLGFPPTQKTVTFEIPSAGKYRLGEIFPMDIRISGIETAINTVQADIGFDSRDLEIIDIKSERSFASIFIQKEINNESGYARITGGLPNPGFSGESGYFATIYFKTKSAGITKIDYLPTSLVLANDGMGTNVIKDYASASYLILPETITPEEEELQKQISDSNLHSKDNPTKLEFFGDGTVMGTKSSNWGPNEKQDTQKLSIVQQLLNIIQKIDAAITSIFTEFFRSVQILFK